MSDERGFLATVRERAGDISSDEEALHATDAVLGPERPGG